jgi:hypothetical protein
VTISYGEVLCERIRANIGEPRPKGGDRPDEAACGRGSGGGRLRPRGGPNRSGAGRRLDRRAADVGGSRRPDDRCLGRCCFLAVSQDISALVALRSMGAARRWSITVSPPRRHRRGEQPTVHVVHRLVVIADPACPAPGLPRGSPRPRPRPNRRRDCPFRRTSQPLRGEGRRLDSVDERCGRHERRVRPSICIRADVVGAHDIRR